LTIYQSENRIKGYEKRLSDFVNPSQTTLLSRQKMSTGSTGTV